MARYDRTFDRPRGPGPRDWASPYDRPFPRGRSRVRPRGGGYGNEYQGGSRGIPTGEPARYGGDYWWLGEHELQRRGVRASYDDAYRRFDEMSRPRFSPIAGNYHAMGGEYGYRRPPRPLREDTWFSDWTRWF